MTKKLYTPAERVAELVAEHGSYRLAAQATGLAFSFLHDIATGKTTNLRADTLHSLGFDVGPKKFNLRAA